MNLRRLRPKRQRRGRRAEPGKEPSAVSFDHLVGTGEEA